MMPGALSIGLDITRVKAGGPVFNIRIGKIH